MHDGEVDEISVRFGRDKNKIQLKWRYRDGPYFYRWFDSF